MLSAEVAILIKDLNFMYNVGSLILYSTFDQSQNLTKRHFDNVTSPNTKIDLTFPAIFTMLTLSVGFKLT